jgi:LacI family transcriptional regulator
LKGYRHALLDHTISFDENLVFSCNLSEQAGADVTQRLLEMSELPDGIFTANDTTGVSCIRVLKQAGIKIPEQIAVAGFNNDPLSKVIEPNLTTMNYPGQEMGELAAATLIRKLDNKEGTSLNTIVLHHNMIIRESSLRKK